ncbi:MAG: hypothetical protein E7466_00375 [Ruminococcaceae bacterium]|nr:hypothetical protein [Oscillospiraceae bacterium]
MKRIWGFQRRNSRGSEKIGSKAGELAKKYRYVVIVLLIGIGLMLMPDFSKKESSSPQIQSTDFVDPTKDLADILSSIQGVGRVRILLTLHSGEQTVYQSNQKVAADGSMDTETVIITDSDRNQSGMVQQVLAPQYRGAIVICQGAGDASVRLAVVEAVSDATGLSTDHISVLKMK